MDGLIVIAVLLTFGAVLVYIFSIFWEVFKGISNVPSVIRWTLSDVKRKKIQSLLSGHKFFEELSRQGKKEFIERVFVLVNRWHWKGQEGLRVTEDMKYRIAASAVQLTFGLGKQFYFPYFHTVRIYPKIFREPISQKSMKGGVTTNGYILLSWEDFLQGESDDKDGVNLGLHEMAHALKVDAFKDSIADPFTRKLNRWYLYYSNIYRSIVSQSDPGLFKPGADRDMNEFFAVCMESFFEKPELFEKDQPQVFSQLKSLLNLDPLNHRGDFKNSPARISEEINGEIKTIFSREVEYDPQWIKLVKAGGILVVFLGLGLFVFTQDILKSQVVLNEPLMIAYAAFGGLANVLFFQQFWRKKMLVSGVYLMVVSFLGFGLLLTTLFIWLNVILPGTDPHVEYYRIQNYDTYHFKRKDGIDHEFAVKFMFCGEPYSWKDAEDWLYTRDMKMIKQVTKGRWVRLDFNWGILGWRNFEGVHFADDDQAPYRLVENHSNGVRVEKVGPEQ